jgi:hypothetical protein
MDHIAAILDGEVSLMKAFALPLVSLLLGAGCGPNFCPCPSGGAQITLSPDLQKMVTGVTADTCSLTSSDLQAEIFLMASKATTCHVRITLANGEVLATDVVFTSLGGCCPDTFGATSSPVVVVDGGAGG